MGLTHEYFHPPLGRRRKGIAALEIEAMTYDALKEFNGQKYRGMAVGGRHTWIYPNALWRERKIAPDQWEFTLSAVKERETPAPVGSGAPLNTQYHWYILAHQRVRKIDSDSYSTLMNGVKYKLAHKSPNWRRWSSEYPDQPSEPKRIIKILEEALARLHRRGGRREGITLGDF